MGLHGMRVALLEGRKRNELAMLVRRFGGEPYCVPAVRDQRACGEEVLTLLNNLEQETSYVVIFSTGIGVTVLFDEAEKLGRLDELRRTLERGTTVCRGPKALAALRREGLSASVQVDEPYTTAEVLAALDSLPLENQFVVLLHYGERNLLLVECLLARCAGLQELLLYDWQLPEDTTALRRLVNELIARRIDAIAFTSEVQARHLFAIASEAGLRSELLDTLQTDTLVAAVGPTCAIALESFGVFPHVVPKHPKMDSMVQRLAQFAFEQRGAA